MAGVMAHEIAHVAACHYGREMTRGQPAAARVATRNLYGRRTRLWYLSRA